MDSAVPSSAALPRGRKHYIEETDTKYYTETAELRSQLTEAQSAMNELRTQNEALTAKNAELLERLGE